MTPEPIRPHGSGTGQNPRPQPRDLAPRGSRTMLNGSSSSMISPLRRTTVGLASLLVAVVSGASDAVSFTLPKPAEQAAPVPVPDASLDQFIARAKRQAQTGSPELKELVAQLDETQFVQVHRSVVVNMRAISHVTRGENETADIHLKGRQETLPVSRTYLHLFKQM